MQLPEGQTLRAYISKKLKCVLSLFAFRPFCPSSRILITTTNGNHL